MGYAYWIGLLAHCLRAILSTPALRGTHAASIVIPSGREPCTAVYLVSRPTPPPTEARCKIEGNRHHF